MRTTTPILLILLSAGTAAADPLTLDAYLEQVKSGGPAYRGAQSAAEGLAQQRAQAGLIYSPMIVVHGQRTDDRKEQTLPELFGTRTVNDHYGAALTKKWSFGPSTSVGYTWMRTDIQGSDFVTSPYWDAMPSASVSVPILKDFGGSQTRAQMDAMRSTIDAGTYEALSGRAQVVFGTRMAYGALVLARAEMETRKDTLARAEKIVAWAARRATRGLGDDAEPLQARAILQVRQIELQAAVEKERDARLGFNRLRGVESDVVPEDLEGLETVVEKLSFDWPSETPERYDLKAEEAKARAALAAWKDAKANAWPDMTAFAQVTGNGQERFLTEANSEAMEFDHPTYLFGVQAVIPLDIPTAAKAAKGYRKNYEGTLQGIRLKRLEVDQQWKQLNDHRNDVETRLAMMADIVKIQKRKAELERTRLNEGRTTQFQYQTYENDYSDARLNYLGLLLEKLSVWAEGESFLSAQRASRGSAKEAKP